MISKIRRNLDDSYLEPFTRKTTKLTKKKKDILKRGSLTVTKTEISDSAFYIPLLGINSIDTLQSVCFIS